MHTLVLTGELDRTSAHLLEAEIERVCAAADGVRLDLGGLARIDAAGVAVIVFQKDLWRRRGYEFALVHTPQAIEQALSVAGSPGRAGMAAPEQPASRPARAPRRRRLRAPARRKAPARAVRAPSQARGQGGAIML